MSVSKIKSVLAAVLVVGLSIGGIGAVVALLPNPVAEAQDKTPAKADPKEKSPVTKEEQLRVLIDQVLAAHGGEDKLTKLRFTMTVKHDNGNIDYYSVQPPKNFRWEEENPKGGKLIVILFPDGRRFWTKKPGEDAEAFVPFGLELPLEFWLDYVKFFGPRQVLRLKDADHKVALLDGEAMIGDRAAVGVEVTGPQFTERMYFDKETHLLLKRGVKKGVDGVEGSGIHRETLFGDYKEFDGIPIARKQQAGDAKAEVTDFRVVDKFDAKVFEQP